jgi:pantothenate synthetase
LTSVDTAAAAAAAAAARLKINPRQFDAVSILSAYPQQFDREDPADSLNSEG